MIDVAATFPDAPKGDVDAVPAINAALAMSPRIYLSRGTYRLASALRLTSACIIEGDGGGCGTVHANTMLCPDPGISAVIIESSGSGSKLRDLGVHGPRVSIWAGESGAWQIGMYCRSTLTTRSPGAYPHALPFVFERISGNITGNIEPPWRAAFESEALKPGDVFPDGNGEWRCVEVNGITIFTQALLEDVLVTSMPSHGLYVDASTQDKPSTNANGWAIRGGRFSENDGWGIYVRGIDTNAFHAQHPGLYSNGRGGFWDSSQHGGTIDSPILEDNSGPVFKIESAISTTIVLNPYVEGNQPQAIGAGMAIVVGGNLATWAGGPGFEQGHHITEFGSFSSALTTLNRDGPHAISSAFGRPGVEMVAHEIVDQTPWNSTESIHLRRSLETGGLELVIGGNVLYRVPLGDSVEPSRFVAPLGIQVGSALDTTNAGIFFSGRRNVGDRLRYTDIPNVSLNVPALAPGGREGLVCTKAGNATGNGALGAVTWTPNTELPMGSRVMPTWGGDFVYRVCNVRPNSASPWRTGSTEQPRENWPTSQFGQQFIDGSLVIQLYDWATQRAEFKEYGTVDS